MTASHELLMNELKGRHRCIAKIIGGRPVHYVDLPIYGNIGDLLIMKGTLSFLESNGIDVRSVSAFFNFHPERANKGDVILFQGGGNFGDLYPGPQQVRESVISVRRDCRIVILPQTIHFKSEGAFDACCRIFSVHPDLHIFTRDEASLVMARRMSKNAYLAPDMAHQLWPIERTSIPVTGSRLGVLRHDDEASNVAISDSLDLITDWPQLVGRRELLARNAYLVLKLLHLAKIDRPIVNLASRLWIRWADQLIDDAVDLLSRYDKVTTDRLHGHILSCLMSIRHSALDNSYGKNSSYIRQWTGRSSILESGIQSSD